MITSNIIIFIISILGLRLFSLVLKLSIVGKIAIRNSLFAITHLGISMLHILLTIIVTEIGCPHVWLQIIILILNFNVYKSAWCKLVIIDLLLIRTVKFIMRWISARLIFNTIYGSDYSFSIWSLVVFANRINFNIYQLYYLMLLPWLVILSTFIFRLEIVGLTL